MQKTFDFDKSDGETWSEVLDNYDKERYLKNNLSKVYVIKYTVVYNFISFSLP